MMAEIDAGAALDAEIARVVFGEIAKVYPGGAFYPVPLRPDQRSSRVPLYSSDLRAAWMVVERLGDIGCCCVSVAREQIAGHTQVDAVVIRDGAELGDHARTFVASADTAPLAICRVALQALDGGKNAAERAGCE